MTAKRYSPKAGESVGKAMYKFKKGKLKTRGNRTVKNPRQAIAIGLSVARKKGARVPKQSKK